MFEALRSGSEHELRLTCYGVGDSGRTAAVRHVHHRDLCYLLE
jgi:hypothetical protein